jgi:hypothetical protein
MGQKLVDYYAKVNKLGGVAAVIKLATKTCVASSLASNVPDSPEMIEKFQKAIKEIFPNAVFSD